MYYDIDLLVNEEIKASYKRINKLLTILIISAVIAIGAIAIAVIIILGKKYSDIFKVGYAMAVFATVEFAMVIPIAFTWQARFDKLRRKQAEEFSGQPLYAKYVALLDMGRKQTRTNGYIAGAGVLASLIACWTLAIIFPYDFYNIYTFYLPILVCDLILLLRRKNAQKIKSYEEEILRELYPEMGQGDENEKVNCEI